MSDKLKELLKEFDLPEELAEKELDDIKTGFHDKFVARAIADSDPDIVNKITGKRLGTLTNLAKQEFGIQEAEVKDKTLEDVLKLGSAKLKGELKILKEQLEGKNPDGKEWEEKIGTISKERDQYKRMAEEKESEFETFKTTASANEKNLKINFALHGVRSGITWSEQATDVAKKGFDLIIAENYKFDFDENGELAVFGKDGNKIDNGKKTGFLTPADVFKAEAQKNGLLKLADKPPGNPAKKEQPEPTSLNGGFARKLPPKALENAGR